MIVKETKRSSRRLRADEIIFEAKVNGNERNVLLNEFSSYTSPHPYEAPHNGQAWQGLPLAASESGHCLVFVNQSRKGGGDHALSSWGCRRGRGDKGKRERGRK